MGNVFTSSLAPMGLCTLVKLVAQLIKGFMSTQVTSNIDGSAPPLWQNMGKKTKHHICIEEARVITTIDPFHHCKFREALEIERGRINLNRDGGWSISRCLIPPLSF